MEMPVSPNQYMPRPTEAIHNKVMELQRLGLAMDQQTWKDCYTKAMLLAMDEHCQQWGHNPAIGETFTERVAFHFEEVALAQLQFFIDNSARIKLAANGLQLPNIN